MLINWLDFIWYELTLKGISEQTLSRGRLLVELSLTRLFNRHWHNSSRLFNSGWHDSSTVTGMIVQQLLAQLCNSGWPDSSTVAGTIIRQSLARLFNSNWHDCSTVAGTIVQQSLAQLFNSHWHNFLPFTGMIIRQSLAWLFNSRWHDSSIATGIILQQSLARSFNNDWHDSSTVTVKICFFYTGRILQQCCSLLKNRAMYQKYDTWSSTIKLIFGGKREFYLFCDNAIFKDCVLFQQNQSSIKIDVIVIKKPMPFWI